MILFGDSSYLSICQHTLGVKICPKKGSCAINEIKMNIKKITSNYPRDRDRKKPAVLKRYIRCQILPLSYTEKDSPVSCPLLIEPTRSYKILSCTTTKITLECMVGPKNRICFFNSFSSHVFCPKKHESRIEIL